MNDGNPSSQVTLKDQSVRVPLWIKLVYGSGDWGMASFGTLRQIFYAIFLTDVVGLDARLASVAALIGVIWDAINDPIVGVLSDRFHSRWGRRRPFLLFFSIPFGSEFLPVVVGAALGKPDRLDGDGHTGVHDQRYVTNSGGGAFFCTHTRYHP